MRSTSASAGNRREQGSKRYCRGGHTGLFRFHSLQRMRRGRSGEPSTCKDCIDGCMYRNNLSLVAACYLIVLVVNKKTRTLMTRDWAKIKRLEYPDMPLLVHAEADIVRADQVSRSAVPRGFPAWTKHLTTYTKERTHGTHEDVEIHIHWWLCIFYIRITVIRCVTRSPTFSTSSVHLRQPELAAPMK